MLASEGGHPLWPNESADVVFDLPTMPVRVSTIEAVWVARWVSVPITWSASSASIRQGPLATVALFTPTTEEGPEGMLTMEDDVEIHALRRRGWSVAAIAGHTGGDPKTIRR